MTKQIYETVQREEILRDLVGKVYLKNQERYLKGLTKSRERITERWNSDLILSIDQEGKETLKTFDKKDKFCFLDIDPEMVFNSFNAEDKTFLKDRMYKRLLKNARDFY